ncbi:bifunctional DNA-binding transcriptional regulator/O6-methylguanine-DNA methyltransferase Ada [Rhizobacter sp. Root1221]|uniref:bifunctional DNA-binding transcriptional regulator/O6-methylguanine-DNA methyltransferase Ada n=1 Tax=Rhizobacter sp. Root1221 TaxID=1736433 RepID=UPI0006FB4272|nr:bifunctional DNA-binding transcriptional regulator/O6-methylguanine-DNA methyltransferase Ada [Rhizobacter sp. Root1221]KQW00284.1 6-O-methylguanine DNA methyltransferase [Rhizobacter sp. Root1221]
MKRDLPPTDDALWAAVAARDGSQDGRFFYGVATTGVFCRPSCGARLPRRENVTFHTTAEAAVQAGFRPCKRCRPDGPTRAEQQAGQVTRACRLIETSENEPGLDALAEVAGLSPHHFHRVFKAVTGITPKAYARAHRTGRLRETLAQARTVTGALYDAGYASSARFYDEAPQALGMAPRTYRQGGADTAIRFALAQCSLGALLVAATDVGLCAIALGDDPAVLLRDLQDRFPQAELQGADAAFELQVARVVGLVERPGAGAELPLDIRGTAFQRRVWQALREIPPGTTVSYAELARRLGAPTAVRAVASACAANTLAVAVPCHRVVRSDGSLSGYRWGVDRKAALLAREEGDR